MFADMVSQSKTRCARIFPKLKLRVFVLLHVVWCPSRRARGPAAYIAALPNPLHRLADEKYNQVFAQGYWRWMDGQMYECAVCTFKANSTDKVLKLT